MKNLTTVKVKKIFCEVFKTLNAALPKGISKGEEKIHH